MLHNSYTPSHLAEDASVNAVPNAVIVAITASGSFRTAKLQTLLHVSNMPSTLRS